MSRVTGVEDRKDGFVFVRVLVLDVVLRWLAGGFFSLCARRFSHLAVFEGCHFAEFLQSCEDLSTLV